MDLEQTRWRKATDIGREHALFELLTKDDVILMYLGFSDDGILELGFSEDIGDVVVNFEDLIRVLQSGKKAAEDDM